MGDPTGAVGAAYQLIKFVVESNKAMASNEQKFKELTEKCEEVSKLRESIRKAMQQKRDNEEEEQEKREKLKRKKTDKDMERMEKKMESLNKYDPCYDPDEEQIPEFEGMFDLSDFFSSTAACSIYGGEEWGGGNDNDDVLESPKISDETDVGREDKLKNANTVLKKAKAFLTEWERNNAASAATSTVSMTTSSGGASSPGGKVDDGNRSPSTTANLTTTTTTTSLWDMSIFSFGQVTPTTDTSRIVPASVPDPIPCGLVDPGYVTMNHLIEEVGSIDGSHLNTADFMLKAGSWVMEKGTGLFAAKENKRSFDDHIKQIKLTLPELNTISAFYNVNKATTDIKLEVSLVHEDIKKVINLIKVREQNYLNAVTIAKVVDPVSPGKSGGRGLLGKLMNRAKDMKAGDSTRGDKLFEGTYDPLPHLNDYRGYSVYRQRGADSKE